MKPFTFVIIVGVWLTSGAAALPPTQHLAVGEIIAIERDKIVLARTPADLDAQDVSVIEAGRTRFHQNGKKSSFEQLRVGYKTRIYFKHERGVRVANSVSWNLSSAR